MNQTNDSQPEDSSKEQQTIPMSARFSKAILMAAVMLMIGWAIGAV